MISFKHFDLFDKKFLESLCAQPCSKPWSYSGIQETSQNLCYRGDNKHAGAVKMFMYTVKDATNRAIWRTGRV